MQKSILNMRLNNKKIQKIVKKDNKKYQKIPFFTLN